MRNRKDFEDSMARIAERDDLYVKKVGELLTLVIPILLDIRDLLKERE